MNKKFLVSVMAAGCLSRFRNGMQFTKEPKEIEVDESQLSILEADNYLKVKVLSDNTTEMQDADGTLAIDAIAAAEAGANTGKGSDADKNGAESTDVSKEPAERLNVIAAAMRGLNLDITADKPTVKELKDAGLDLSAKERDEAWDVLVAEHAESNA